MKQVKLTRSAFTLLEIVVVIAILLFLAALLSPVLFEAKKNAKVVSSIMRLKQLHKAIEIYMLNNNGQRPPFGYRGTLGWSEDAFISPCGYKPLPPTGGMPTGLPDRSYHYNYPYDKFYKPELQDRYILYVDLSCNLEAALTSVYARKGD